MGLETRLPHLDEIDQTESSEKTGKKQSQITRDLSSATAPSESFIYREADLETQSRNQNAPSPAAATECRDVGETLAGHLQHIFCFALCGSLLLVALGVTQLMEGEIGQGLGYLVLAGAAGVTGLLGCRRKDSRYLLGFFITSFILVAFLGAKTVLLIIVAAKEGARDVPEGYESAQTWYITRLAVQAVMLSMFAVYWGFAAWFSEKAVRVLTEFDISRQDRSVVEPVGVIVIGHPAYTANFVTAVQPHTTSSHPPTSPSQQPQTKYHLDTDAASAQTDNYKRGDLPSVRSSARASRYDSEYTSSHPQITVIPAHDTPELTERNFSANLQK